LLLPVLLFCAVAVRAEKFDYTLNVTDTAGHKTALSKYRGKNLLLIYYSEKCGHCKSAVETLSKLQGKCCANVLGVITSSDSQANFMKNKKRKVGSYFDGAKSLKEKFRLERVPATIAVDSLGNILFIKEKFLYENYADVAGALVSRLCGGTPFNKTMTARYYGEMVCDVCHSAIHAWWDTTRHADAYNQVAKAAFGRTGYREGMASKVDPEQLKYATVGFGMGGGYDPARHQKNLLGVQCESCHGPGGPHGSGPVRDWEARCTQCHNSSRDPTFHLETWLKKLNHPKEK
jgi:peroxiredoxin